MGAGASVNSSEACPRAIPDQLQALRIPYSEAVITARGELLTLQLPRVVSSDVCTTVISTTPDTCASHLARPDIHLTDTPRYPVFPVSAPEKIIQESYLTIDSDTYGALDDGEQLAHLILLQTIAKTS